ncbi:MAG TPA: DUF4058 domain-containing protein [Urbifossiella sp.]|nr:DUF4058 domain-containing protein [Urbifossiella sp.]
MPLLDHSHRPLLLRWEYFVESWATDLSFALNALLPDGYFAEPNVQFAIPLDEAGSYEPGTFTALGGWTPTPPTHDLPIEATESVAEVGVYRRTAGPELAGAIVLVCTGNKYTPGKRESLVTKCCAYLQAWVGLVLVDVVPHHLADLHAALLNRLGTSVPAEPGLLTAAYRPVGQDGGATLEVWREPVAVGRALPTLPLWLRDGLCLPVELEAAYTRTCVEQKVQPAA